MGIRVGAIININKAWNAYQAKLAFYKKKLDEAQADRNLESINYWQNSISMTEAEIGEFLDIVI